MEILATQLGAVLKSHGFMLATAESCTGGGVAQAVTEAAGSSNWFDRGFVTYSNLAKQQMLGVKDETLARCGAVSKEVVLEMVEGALKFSAAQVVLAVSGIAGPGGGTVEKPVGTVWFAWGRREAVVYTKCYHLKGNRAEVRALAVQIAMQGVIDLLNQRIETA